MNRRVRRLLAATMLALAVAGVVVVGAQSSRARLAADFTIDYSAATMVREGQLAAIYDQERLAATERRVAPGTPIDPRLPFNKPLAGVLPYLVLSWFSIGVAFRLWQLVAVALIVVALLALQRGFPIDRHAVVVGVVAVLAAGPTWSTLGEGQATPLILLGAALALLCTRMRPTNGWTRPLIAMAAGALLAIKPQYLPVYLLVVLAARLWVELIAASAGGVAVVMSPMVGGTSGLAGMLHNALLANQVVSIHADESWVGLLGGILPAHLATAGGLCLYAASGLLLAWLAWRQSVDAVLYAALAGTLAVLASPHALPHDLLLLTAPAWLALHLYRAQALPNPIPALLALDLAVVIDLRGVGVPLAPVVMTLAVAWFLVRVRQRSRRLRPPLALAG